jgi:hypothetical protein
MRKKAKIRLTEKVYDERFDYATSARESTCEWASKEISTKEWVNTLYDPPAKKLVKRLLKAYGVKGTRTKVRAMLTRFNGGYLD